MYFLSIYPVPIRSSTLHAHAISHKPHKLQGRYHCSHYIGEETEAQRGHIPYTGEAQNLNPGVCESRTWHPAFPGGTDHQLTQPMHLGHLGALKGLYWLWRTQHITEWVAVVGF